MVISPDSHKMGRSHDQTDFTIFFCGSCKAVATVVKQIPWLLQEPLACGGCSFAENWK